jgi:hypothetical protein
MLILPLIEWYTRSFFRSTRCADTLQDRVADVVALRRLNKDVEVWLSSGRDDTQHSIRRAIQILFRGLVHAKLVENHWQTWPAFRTTVASMDLLILPSYTESFWGRSGWVVGQRFQQRGQGFPAC